ncbi:hypothetical protein ABZU75_41155, partial [Streptosporangium sp. NPDC005286]|uniref:hypothetical protein n=1 Tax=Streptosporangium sp. NPDC005286 TaxID=3154463 RepID=UPI0033BADF05
MAAASRHDAEGAGRLHKRYYYTASGIHSGWWRRFGRIGRRASRFGDGRCRMAGPHVALRGGEPRPRRTHTPAAPH